MKTSKHTFRFFWIAAAALILAGSAGCGGDGGDEDTAVDPGQEEAIGDPAETDPTPDPFEDGDDGPPDVEDEEAVLPACGTDSPEALMACVERERYVEDLNFIAEERVPGSAHWQAVQDLCATRMETMGYSVQLHDYGSGVNVIGRMPGAATPAEEVMISAHYDHIEGCEGADDDGTGVAGLLEAGRVLAMAGFDRTLVLACWDEEERGLVGSEAYAMEADTRGDQILVNYVFEMLGFKSDAPDSQQVPAGFDAIWPEEVAELAANDNRGDFIAIVNDDLSHESALALTAFAESVALSTVMLELASIFKNSDMFYDLRRSDHASFWLVDYPAMMITDTANFRNPYYHCAEGPDVVSTLDHDFAVQVIQATLAAAAVDLGM